MSKVKLVVFTDLDTDHRLERLKEECESRENIEVVSVNMRRMVLTDREIYDEKGEKLDFSNSVVWALSNLTTTHCVSLLLYNKETLIWPDKKSLFFADKFDSSVFFSKIGVLSPKTSFINSLENIESVANSVGGYPCIIKKTIGSMGMFVEVVSSNKEVEEFIQNTFQRAKKSKMAYNRIKFLLQEYIEETNGSDYRVLCLDGEVLGVIKREAVSGFKSNVSLGGKATHIPLDDKLKEYALKIMKEGNLFYAGIDFMKAGDDYMVLEVNTSAQFKGFEAATRINVAGKIIDKLLEKRINKK